jgi:hypothetical protein
MWEKQKIPGNEIASAIVTEMALSGPGWAPG